jgi:hypothetical protein
MGYAAVFSVVDALKASTPKTGFGLNFLEII